MRISCWSSDVCSSDLCTSCYSTRMPAGRSKIGPSAAWPPPRRSLWSIIADGKNSMRTQRHYRLDKFRIVPENPMPVPRGTEERRVGKKVVRPCGTLGWPYHEKKKRRKKHNKKT